MVNPKKSRLFIRKGKTDKELFHAIRRGKFRMPEHITNSAQKIIKWMLEHEPEKRPSAQQVRPLLNMLTIFKVIESEWLSLPF